MTTTAEARQGVNRLCEDCQRSCKQSARTVVVNCPHYARTPRQATLDELAARQRKAKGARKGCAQ